YRVRDYGIWERGDKGNHGLPERNASSIGLVKAALEALEGLDLYGPHGDGSATLVIPHDAIVRLRRALRGLLPRESASKEVDSACLAVIGYPAWAVEDPQLVERTRSKIRSELGGAYGYKRFRRDGHQTVVEDHTRLHYEREELAQFEHIECEWPLFWAYELITACCEERWAEARQWRQRLAGVSVLSGGNALLPELYRVPAASIEAERRQPGSQPREANENVPLLWTQSLTWLADLLLAGLISPDDLDPTGRRQTASLGASEVLVALVPANAEIAAELEAAGLPVAGRALPVRSSSELAQRMALVGANPRLGLSGHPPVRMETMATARLYRSADGSNAMAFLPAVLEESTFYLADDAEQLIDTVSAELRLLQRHWRGAGAPLLLIPVAEGAYRSDSDAFVRLGQTLAGGLLDGVPVQLAPLAELIDQACWQTLPAIASGTVAASAVITALPLLASLESQPLTAQQEQELEDSSIGDLLERLWQSICLPEQAEVLEQLSLRLGPAAQLQGPQQQAVSLRELLDEVYRRALEQGEWGVV
ncbi:MAG: glycoside hydrolase family 15 protein, partial [Prochlorococcaceae cyanobacterium]